MKLQQDYWQENNWSIYGRLNLVQEHLEIDNNCKSSNFESLKRLYNKAEIFGCHLQHRWSKVELESILKLRTT